MGLGHRHARPAIALGAALGVVIKSIWPQVKIVWGGYFPLYTETVCKRTPLTL